MKPSSTSPSPVFTRPASAPAVPSVPTGESDRLSVALFKLSVPGAPQLDESVQEARSAVWTTPPDVRPPKRNDLYRLLSHSAHAMHAENGLLREHIDDQRTHISDLRHRLGEMGVERSRLRAGRTVPAWVASGLDRRLTTVEGRKASLEDQVAFMCAIGRAMLNWAACARGSRMLH